MDYYEIRVLKQMNETLSELIGYGEGRQADAELRRKQFVLVSNRGEPTHSAAIAPSQLNQNSQRCFIFSESKGDEEEMKHITKRADGRYQSYKIFNGKRYYVYGQTQRECYEKRKKLLKPKLKAKPKKKVPTVYEFAKYYVETFKKHEVVHKSYVNYRSFVNCHLNFNTPLDSITTQDLQERLNSLPATKIKKEVYNCMRQVFRKAYELDLIKKNIADFLVLGKIKKPEKTAFLFLNKN